MKYPALVLAGLLGIGHRSCECSAAEVGRLAERSRVDALFFGLVALLVGGSPWYLRAYLYTGNPVYPFFRQVFGGAGLDEVLDPIKRPLAVTALEPADGARPLSLQPDRFDSFSHQFGPVFLLFLPALALERPPRRVLAIVGAGLRVPDRSA